MLQWSSALFSTVVLHAYYRWCEVYHHVFLLLTVTSLLFHCEHHPVVRVIDKALAHFVFALVLLDTPLAFEKQAVWLLLFPCLAGCAWVAQSFWPEISDKLHLALHITGVCGMHMYLCLLY